MAGPLVLYSMSEDSNSTLSSVGQFGKDYGLMDQAIQQNNPAASTVSVVSDQESVVGKDTLIGFVGNALAVDEQEVAGEFAIQDLEEGTGENEIEDAVDADEKGTVDEAALEDLDRYSTNQDKVVEGEAADDEEEDDACSRPSKKQRI
ncbi:hypothetical protein EJB05_16078, partial [Eragrostis curvula]